MKENRKRNQAHQLKLDEEMKKRMTTYKNKINDDVSRRNNELDLEE